MTLPVKKLRLGKIMPRKRKPAKNDEPILKAGSYHQVSVYLYENMSKML